MILWKKILVIFLWSLWICGLKLSKLFSKVVNYFFVLNLCFTLKTPFWGYLVSFSIIWSDAHFPSQDKYKLSLTDFWSPQIQHYVDIPVYIIVTRFHQIQINLKLIFHAIQLITNSFFQCIMFEFDKNLWKQFLQYEENEIWTVIYKIALIQMCLISFCTNGVNLSWDWKSFTSNWRR